MITKIIKNVLFRVHQCSNSKVAFRHINYFFVLYIYIYRILRGWIKGQKCTLFSIKHYLRCEECFIE